MCPYNALFCRLVHEEGRQLRTTNKTFLPVHNHRGTILYQHKIETEKPSKSITVSFPRYLTSLSSRCTSKRLSHFQTIIQHMIKYHMLFQRVFSSNISFFPSPNKNTIYFAKRKLVTFLGALKVRQARKPAFLNWRYVLTNVSALINKIAHYFDSHSCLSGALTD